MQWNSALLKRTKKIVLFRIVFFCLILSSNTDLSQWNWNEVSSCYRNAVSKHFKHGTFIFEFLKIHFVLEFIFGLPWSGVFIWFSDADEIEMFLSWGVLSLSFIWKQELKVLSVFLVILVSVWTRWFKLILLSSKFQFYILIGMFSNFSGFFLWNIES